MAIRGRALLGVWADVLPAAEEEFNRWYGEQHLPERLGVPGFLRGRRYLAVTGAPRYFTLYETESREVLSSPAYLARLNDPTEWTRRVLPTMRNVVRNAYRLVETAGREDGPALVTLRLAPAAGRDAELRTRFQREILAGMTRIPGVLSAALLEAEPLATGVVTEERRLVGAMGAAPPFLCLAELREPGIVDRPPWRELVGESGPALGRELVQTATANVYRLTHSLDRSPA